MAQQASEIAARPASHDPLSPVKVDYGAILSGLGLDPTNPQAQAVVLVCQRYDLDPVLRHVLLIKERAEGGESARPYITRDGLLHVAHKSGQLDGIQVLEQSEDETHYRAVVAVFRKDMARPFTYVGRYPKRRLTWVDDLDEHGRKVWEEGHDGKRRPRRKQVEALHPYGPEMAVKCAEVMCLRRAFDVAIAAREEMWDAPEFEDHTTAAPVIDSPAPEPEPAEDPRPLCEVKGPKGEQCSYPPLHATNFHSWNAPAEVKPEDIPLARDQADGPEPEPEPKPPANPQAGAERARIIALIRKKAEERKVADKVLWDDLHAMDMAELKALFNEVGKMKP